MPKTIAKRPLSKNILAVISAILFVVSSVGLFYHFIPFFASKNQILGAQDQRRSFGFPVRLIIPALDISTSVRSLGVSANGEMEVPDNSADVGWYMYGTLPGNRGSAVIAGHLNGKYGEKGIFYELNKLKEGDMILVEDDIGGIGNFVVRETRLYDPGYADEVFASGENAQLNLITCEGVWDKNKNSYSKRLVVFTDMIY